jgi:hypothetical protein
MTKEELLAALVWHEEQNPWFAGGCEEWPTRPVALRYSDGSIHFYAYQNFLDGICEDCTDRETPRPETHVAWAYLWEEV